MVLNIRHPNVFLLPAYYTLPREAVGTKGEFSNIPRNPREVLTDPGILEKITSKRFLLFMDDMVANMVWPFIGRRGWIEVYSGYKEYAVYQPLQRRGVLEEESIERLRTSSYFTSNSSIFNETDFEQLKEMNPRSAADEKKYQKYLAGQQFVADVLTILEANRSDRIRPRICMPTCSNIGSISSIRLLRANWIWHCLLQKTKISNGVPKRNRRKYGKTAQTFQTSISPT